MTLEEMKAQVRLRLKAITRQEGFPEDEVTGDGTTTRAAMHAVQFDLPSTDFPIPDVLKFILKEVVGLPVEGPFEKVAWAAFGAYEGTPFVVAHQKFGLKLTIRAESDRTERLRAGLIGKLKKAILAAEGYLKTVFERQLEDANVTIENKFHAFTERYMFFRKLATDAYVAPPPRSEVTHRDSNGSPIGRITDVFRCDREGFFYGNAAIEAYFNRLEHWLVLLVPFLPAFRPEGGGLKRLLDAQWGTKLKSVLPVEANNDAKRLYDKLKHLKDIYRNPTAHGGFEARGLSVFFHAKGMGAIPARLTAFAKGPSFSLFPVTNDVFSDACNLFDEVDSYIRSAPRDFACRWVESGLDLRYDAEGRKEYLAATSSEAAFQKLRDYIEYQCDRHANMDY